jgi:uncharacterized protein (DUF488 family)
VPPTSAQLLTVGHSTHSIEEFLALLHGAGVTHLVDIRKLPGSTRHPQFDEENLRASLEAAGIAYSREARLGGLRGTDRSVNPATNAFWENKSFHRYADYALTAEFAAGRAALEELLGEERLPAIMCSEAVWWRCHRRLVSDHLLARGVAVAHLMPGGRVSPATLTAGARIRDDRVVVYPAV